MTTTTPTAILHKAYRGELGSYRKRVSHIMILECKSCKQRILDSFTEVQKQTAYRKRYTQPLSSAAQELAGVSLLRPTIM